MITPFAADDALLADMQQANAGADTCFAWWLGQSGFLVKWQERYVLFDPYLSDSLTKKYASTDKPHVRMTELAIRPERLNFINVVTSSHNHTDHLDAETLLPLFKVNSSLLFVAPAANQQFAADRLGVPLERVTPIDVGEVVEAGGFKIHAVPAAHEELATDDAGRHLYVGYVVEAGPLVMYHSGDTIRYEGMAERLKCWAIDIAFLPINGRLSQRRVSGNLWGREAAALAHEIGAKLVVPCHYEMFEFNTESPADFIAECTRLRQAHRVLRCGERLTFTKGQSRETA